MPDYGERRYWDQRYEKSKGDPYDWLFPYKDVQRTIENLVSKEESILLVGCGNAPFSPDVHAAGYKNVIHMDFSPEAIKQQSETYPEMRWEEGDVLDMEYEDSSFDAVIDKSLIDTLLCGSNAAENVHRMMSEIYRVLRPGGCLLCFSLHGENDVRQYFTKTKTTGKGSYFDWDVTMAPVPNPRFEEEHEYERSPMYTTIIAVKPVPKVLLKSFCGQDELSNHHRNDGSNDERTLASHYPIAAGYYQMRAGGIKIYEALQPSETVRLRYIVRRNNLRKMLKLAVENTPVDVLLCMLDIALKAAYNNSDSQ